MASYRLAYSALSRLLLSALGMGPGRASIDVSDVVEVRMGWAFRSTGPRSAVTSAIEVRESSGRRILGGIGVHGWRGRWRVNGATQPLVRISFDPRHRARVLGIPVRLSTLEVGCTQPQALVAELGGRS